MQNEVSKLPLNFLMKMKQAAASAEIRLENVDAQTRKSHWTRKTFHKVGIEVVSQFFYFFLEKYKVPKCDTFHQRLICKLVL